MAERPYTVVVGVSATSKSPTALDWGRAQAGSAGRLVAVRAWRMPNPQATPSGTPAGRISRAEEVEIEATGGLTLEVAADYAATGVDYLSVGGLTHSSPILDLALDLV